MAVPSLVPVGERPALTTILVGSFSLMSRYDWRSIDMYSTAERREMIGSTPVPPHSRLRLGSFQIWIALMVPLGEPLAYRRAISATKSA